MRLVRLIDCGEPTTPLTAFLGGLMRDFKPEPFVMQIGRLEHNLGLYHKEGWNEHRHAEFLRHFEELQKIEEIYGLTLSAKHTEKIVQAFRNNDATVEQRLDEMVRVSRRILNDEMESLCYFDIPRDKLHYWTNLEPFGPKVAEHFPNSGEDIEEAAKCIALNRWTASAFHSLRVQEAAINAICQAVGAALPTENERSWGKVLSKIDRELTSREKSKKPEWIKWYPAMRSAYAFLNNAKSLWRDDTMHVGPKKDDKEALRIFDSTRILMQHLAEWINEKGIFQQ